MIDFIYVTTASGFRVVSVSTYLRGVRYGRRAGRSFLRWDGVTKHAKATSSRPRNFRGCGV